MTDELTPETSPLEDSEQALESDALVNGEPAPADRLGELVRYMASQLVDSPDSIEVIADDRGSSVHIMLRVPEEEMGRVIGRQGRIAKAMRTVVMIAGSRQNVRASLDIEG